MSSECLNLVCDGQFEIIKITEELYDPVIEFYENNFMRYENISIACNLCSNIEASKEVTTLLREILKDNISFAAIDTKTQELVSICVNKMLNPSAHITLDEVFANFKTPNMKKVGDYLQIMEWTYNIFDEWKIDCAIELTFLSTKIEYGRKGIGLALAKYLLEFATKLKEGDSKFSQQLPEHIKGQRPKAVISVLTSRYSQVLAEKLNFDTLFKEENTKFEFEGQTFAEKIHPQHKYSTFVAKRL